MFFWLSLVVVTSLLAVVYFGFFHKIRPSAIIVLLSLLIVREVFSGGHNLILSTTYRDSSFQEYVKGVDLIFDFCEMTGLYVVAICVGIMVIVVRGFGRRQ